MSRFQRHVALLFGIVLASGCLQLGGEDPSKASAPRESGADENLAYYVTGPDGRPFSLDEQVPRLNVSWILSEVGHPGPEPSVGITSSGCIFFTALERVMRSCDKGGSWKEVQDVFSNPSTWDPYLWVDPVTDRIFNVQMHGLHCTWIAWSDDDGESWLGNPWDCGPIPKNDHIKLATGPWTSSGYGLLGARSPVYPQATYFCYSKQLAVFCHTSFDGGVTFPVGGQVVGLVARGNLHGAITTAPDGTVYLPPRTSIPTLFFSKDNGLTWSSRSMGQDVGTPSPRKNSEVATDNASNAYHAWIGRDFGVYVARSLDSGTTWDERSLRVSPVQVISTTFAHIDAGDPGRIAIAYLGSSDTHLLHTTSVANLPWDGNPHTAPNNTVYDLYVTISLNALEATPTFHTFKVTRDPVQAGSICIGPVGCRIIGGINRNLLDFNDLHIDRQGRVYVAFADGCTGPCAENPDPVAVDSRSAAGVLAVLDVGPSLYEAVDLARFRTE